MSVLTGFLYSFDKVEAQDKRFRIPVYVLMMLTALGGAIGAYVVMLSHRHKTKQMSFRVLIYFSLVIQLGLLIALFIGFLIAKFGY